MLTPWPFYLASMGLSLLLMVWGRYALPATAPLEPVHRWAYFTVVHNRWYFPGDTIVASDAAATASSAANRGPQPMAISEDEAARIAAWHRFRSFATYLPLFVNTVRSLGATTLAAQVFMRDGGDVRRPALSNVAAILIGVAPYIVRPALFTAASTLASADAALLAITAGIVGLARPAGPGRTYGDLTAVGGTCPLNVPRMNAGLPLVGCGLEALSAADKQRLGEPRFRLEAPGVSPGTIRNVFGGGPAAQGEFWSAVVFTLIVAPIPMLYSVVVLVAGLLRYGLQLRSLLARSCRRRVVISSSAADGSNNRHRNNDGCNSEAGQQTPKLASLCGTMAVIIAVYMLCMFPVHVVQQTRPSVIRAYDGFGPAVRRDSAAALNGTSWSDWFLVERPTEPLGFFGVWWREHGKRWDTLLAFV
jgi:hypothetical protein